MWKILSAIVVAGAIGGLINGILSQSEITMPVIRTVEGAPVLVPGILGNVLIGAVVAIVSYGLYGPLANAAIIGRDEGTAAPTSVRLSLASLAGAILVGFSGGKWITAEAAQRLNHATASTVTRELAATSQLAQRALMRIEMPADAAPNAGLAERAAEAMRTAVVEPTDAEALLRSLQAGTPLESFALAQELRNPVGDNGAPADNNTR